MSEELRKPEISEQPDKRFKFSREQFAKDRIKGVQIAVGDLKKQHPEVVSLALFGSMTKGTAKEASDIDGWLYVDTDQITDMPKQELTSDIYLDEKDFFNPDVVTGKSLRATTLNPDIAQRYSVPLRERLKKDLNLEDGQVGHVRTMPISREIIQTHLNELLIQAEKYLNFENVEKEWESQRPDIRAEGVEVDDLVEYEKNKPRFPGTPWATPNLTRLFHLDVGGGLGKYRKILLDELRKAGDKGEAAWQAIIKDTKYNEADETNKNARYPLTLEAAAALYDHEA